MKRLVFGMISVLALAAIGSAEAAPVRRAVPVADPYDQWTGGYFGGNVGYSWGGWRSSNPAGNTLAAVGFGNFGPGLQGRANPSVDGWIGGIQGGYNWHIHPSWVVGLEGDFQWTGQRASNGGSATLLTIPFRDGTLTGVVSTANTWKLDWLSTVRARAGYLVAPQWLVYGTGGVAFGRAQYSNTTVSTLTFTGTGGFTLTGTAFNSETRTQTGWTLGGGIESQIARNWSAKLEYIYVDLGSHRFLATTTSVTDVKLRDNIVRVGVNYQFH